MYATLQYSAITASHADITFTAGTGVPVASTDVISIDNTLNQPVELAIYFNDAQYTLVKLAAASMGKTFPRRCSKMTIKYTGSAPTSGEITVNRLSSLV